MTQLPADIQPFILVEMLLHTATNITTFHVTAAILLAQLVENRGLFRLKWQMKA